MAISTLVRSVVRLRVGLEHKIQLGRNVHVILLLRVVLKIKPFTTSRERRQTSVIETAKKEKPSKYEDAFAYRRTLSFSAKS